MSGAVDLAQAERFLTLLDEEAAHWCFRTFPEKRGAGRGRNYSGELATVSDALRLDNGNGRGVYVVVNEGGHSGKDITRIRAVFADFDPPKTAAMPERFDLEPHIIVESSRGKHHVYWLVDGLEVGQFEAVQKAIVARYGSDPVPCDLPRVMRLPGFIHCKPADAAHDGRPFQSRIIHESGALPYTAETILGAFATERPGNVLKLSARMPPKLTDGRRCDLYRAGCEYRDAGARGRRLLGLMRGYNAANFDPPKPDAEVVETARNVERYAQNKRPEPPKVASAAELLRREFQPVQWAVQGILPEGVSILSGDPKIGKSWLLYQACVAVAAGKPLWGGRDAEIGGDALMLALEDNDRRLQRRLATLMPRFTTTNGRGLVQPSVERLHYATEWPRADDGVAALKEWLTEHPGCRLVVVDTVSAFRQKDIARNKSAYAADYEVGEMFKPLARDFSCAIVLVMHNRKQQSPDALQLVSGTQGMTGGVDNVLVMRRERGHMDAGLYVDGRDIEEPQEIALRFDNGYWSSDGRTVEQAQMSAERRQVLEVVDKLGENAKVRAIADALAPKKYGSVRSLLAKMVAAGELALSGGLYSHPREQWEQGNNQEQGNREAA